MDDATGDYGNDDGHEGDQRTTAPLSEFDAREAGVGALVALAGLAVTVLFFVRLSESEQFQPAETKQKEVDLDDASGSDDDTRKPGEQARPP